MNIYKYVDAHVCMCNNNNQEKQAINLKVGGMGKVGERVTGREWSR